MRDGRVQNVADVQEDSIAQYYVDFVKAGETTLKGK